MSSERFVSELHDELLAAARARRDEATTRPPEARHLVDARAHRLSRTPDD